MSKDMVNFEFIKASLNKAEYRKLKDTQGDFKVVVTDDINQKNITTKGFHLVAKREVELNPKALFKISVEFIIECKFDEKSIKYFNEDSKKIMEFIEKRKQDIVKSRNIGNQMSLIVAQLSAYHSMNPLILPPYPIPKNKKENDNTNGQ